MLDTEDHTKYRPPLKVNQPESSGYYWFRGKLCGRIRPRPIILQVNMYDDMVDIFFNGEYCTSQELEGEFDPVQPPRWITKRPPDF